MDAPSGALALEDEQLVAKREDLGLELRARPQQRSNRSQESQKGRVRHRRHADPARRKHQSFQCGPEFRRYRGWTSWFHRGIGERAAPVRWEAQEMARPTFDCLFLPEAITSEGSGDGCTISSDAIWTGSSHIRWGQPDRLHS